MKSYEVICKEFETICHQKKATSENDRGELWIYILMNNLIAETITGSQAAEWNIPKL